MGCFFTGEWWHAFKLGIKVAQIIGIHWQLNNIKKPPLKRLVMHSCNLSYLIARQIAGSGVRAIQLQTGWMCAGDIGES